MIIVEMRLDVGFYNAKDDRFEEYDSYDLTSDDDIAHTLEYQHDDVTYAKLYMVVTGATQILICKFKRTTVKTKSGKQIRWVVTS